MEMRSPAVSSMSISRGGGWGLTSLARSSSSSVLSPMADTATQTSLPAFFASAMRRATRLMLAASASDEPPYFWTTIGTVELLGTRRRCRFSRGVHARSAESIDRPHRGTRQPYAGRERPRARHRQTAVTGTGGGIRSAMTIEVQGVRRAFGDVLAVDSISLTARPGEVTALIGPNGSGKTTLLLMLATLLVPDQGTIRVAGLDPVSQHAAVRAQIGWMPDGFGTWDALTVREVLLTIAAAYRIAPGQARTRTDELLATVHLEDLADRRARVLSRGQKQRLG